VTNSSVDQENIPIAVLVCCTIVILDKIIQPSHTYTLICISRFANRNKLVSSYIIIKPRCYYPDTRYNNNKGNSIPIYKNIFYYSNREIVFWNPCIYFLNPNWDYYFLPHRYTNSGSLVYIIYKPPIVYTCSIDSRTVFGLKPIAEGLIGIYIDSIGSNWFRFNRMKKRLLFEPKLEPFLGKGFFTLFYPEPYSAVV
jgi:hypothetical protein